MLPPSAIIQKGGFSMTEHEKYQEHIRHTHDAFCKTVIRHAAIDAARSIRSRRKREISLEYLIEEKHYPFSTTDKYFAEQSGMTSYPLFVCGQMVLLESPELAAALSALYRFATCTSVTATPLSTAIGMLPSPASNASAAQVPRT